MQHNRCKPWVAQRLHQVAARIYMSPHDGPFGVGEGSLLHEDLAWRPELADIVQQGRRFDQRHLLAPVESHPPSRTGSVPSHAARMPVQVGIALVHRDSELLEEFGALLDAPRSPQSIERGERPPDLALGVHPPQPSPHQQVAEHRLWQQPMPPPQRAGPKRGHERKTGGQR
jgi:hypothetical protein